MVSTNEQGRLKRIERQKALKLLPGQWSSVSRLALSNINGSTPTSIPITPAVPGTRETPTWLRIATDTNRQQLRNQHQQVPIAITMSSSRRFTAPSLMYLQFIFNLGRFLVDVMIYRPEQDFGTANRPFVFIMVYGCCSDALKTCFTLSYSIMFHAL
ncbi:hypothetical protein QVD17_18255 [Tagetes erecta]|uniref:Uncharacterized protein n=1 Tax=Tagetes erecta TaxID=13708 RepID=A0AAD8KK47_TARER|nr:hypothetical protein QVD17_18255 [Tagetes erecta]